MDGRTLERAIETIGDVGIATLAAGFGLVLLGAAALEVWSRRRDWLHLAKMSVPLLVVAALGAGFSAARPGACGRRTSGSASSGQRP